LILVDSTLDSLPNGLRQPRVLFTGYWQVMQAWILFESRKSPKPEKRKRSVPPEQAARLVIIE
jgi:hypothetical protein